MIEAASALGRRGESVSAVVEAPQTDAATDLDVLRVVMRVHAVMVGDAKRLVGEAGHPRFLEPLTVVVPEYDPWYDQLFGSEPPSDGTPLPG
jgi:hypothetical protein